MPRIKIIGLPKAKYGFQIGEGPDNCDDGYVWDDLIQQCVPDPNGTTDESFQTFQPHWQSMGSGQATTVTGEKKTPFMDKVVNSKAFKLADKWGKRIETGALIAQPIVDYVNDRKDQKRWDKWFHESALPDNMYAAKSASATGNRGDWDINTGIFRPNEIGFKSKGQYTNYFQQPGNVITAYGGTPIKEDNMQKIRIQITSVPKPKMFMGGNMYSPDMMNNENLTGQNYSLENLEKFKPKDAYQHLGENLQNLSNQIQSVYDPKRFDKYFMATGGQPSTYSGQMGYGINLGQKRIYTDMPESKSEQLSKTLKPVPRHKANIEAENGETAWGDLDNDGALEHMEIGGNRHVDGGTPLNVPEGTFIFSDTKNMTIKDENILKMFSMPANKKGYTPAQIAKKYDINKYKAIIEDPSVDEMRKGTAQLMVKTYQKKLAQLALIQEQMKGFPQGIPDVAKKVMPELSQQGQQSQAQIPQQQDDQQMPKGSKELPENAMAYGGNYYAKVGLSVTNTTTKRATPDQAMNSAKEYMTQWMQSPMYLKMLAKSDPSFQYISMPFGPSVITNQGHYNKTRNNQLNAVQYDQRNSNKKEKQEGTAALTQSYESWYPMMTGQPGISVPSGDKYYPKITFLKNSKDDIYGTAVHEISHATDAGGVYIPIADLNMMNSFKSPDFKSSPHFKDWLKQGYTPSELTSDTEFYKDQNDWINYINKPTETRARLNDFRRSAKEQGLYDPFTQPFKLEYLKKYKPTGGGYDPIDQLRDTYSDQEIEIMLNSISKANRNLTSNAAAYGGTTPLGMYAGGGEDPTTTTTIPSSGVYDQTLSPNEIAKLDDPEYPILIGLLDKLAKKSDGKYYLSVLKPGEQKELSRLITKFGLSHVDEIIGGKTIKGYNVTQNSTPGYTWYDKSKKKKVGFFGGMTPDMYEDKVIESIYPADRVAKMTPIEKRRLFLKELGIDDTKYSDTDLSDMKKFYTDKKFFNDVFYPAFTKTFMSDDYRKLKGDDWQIGLEHYDSYKWKAPTPPPPTTGAPGKFVCTDSGVAAYDPKLHANLTVYNDYASAQQACYKGPGKTTIGKIPKMPFKYMTPDLVNMAAAAAVPPKKYLPWAPQLPFEPGDVVFEDWRAKAAERQGLMNKMMNQINTYSPGTSAASNLSFLAGQGSEGLIKDIADVDARNVATANAFSQQEIARRDKNMAANLGRAEDLYKGNIIANQQYDNAKRQYINNMAKTFGQAWKNRMQLGLLNNVNTMYPVDPVTGYSWFTGGKGTDNFNSGSGGTGYTSKDYTTLYNQYIKDGWPDDLAKSQAREDINNSRSGKSTGNTPNISDYNFGW